MININHASDNQLVPELTNLYQLFELVEGVDLKSQSDPDSSAYKNHQTTSVNNILAQIAV